MRTRTVVAALSFVLISIAAVSARTDDQPTRLPLAAADVPAPGVEWYGLYMMLEDPPAKIGWTREEFMKSGDAWVSSFSVHLDMTSMGQGVTIDITQTLEFDGVAPFALRGGRSESKQGGGAETVELVRGKDGFTAKSVQGGETNSPPVPAIDYTLADSLGSQLWFRSPRAVGDTLRVRSFDLSKLKCDVETITVKSRTETVALGIPTVYYESSVRSDAEGDRGVARTDARGKLLSIVIGSMFEARLEAEDTAKQLAKGGDLFVKAMANLDQPIGDAVNVERLVLEVDGPGAANLADAPRQSVARDEKSGVVTLSLGAEFGKDAAPTAKEIEDALAETVALPIKSPAVVALAAQAVGDAKTPREKVGRLVHFVSEYVKDALIPAERSVPEIIATKAGDCSEHARLFAVLARAAGVPAREVSGLMYMGDEVKTFGGHAWNEVVLDGKWVPVDATWDEVEVDAAHVTTEREGKGMSAAATMGGVHFRLKEVRHAKEPPK